jgi:hypothetical protein
VSASTASRDATDVAAAADLKADTLTNTATVTVTPPNGTPARSDPSTAVVTVVPPKDPGGGLAFTGATIGWEASAGWARVRSAGGGPTMPAAQSPGSHRCRVRSSRPSGVVCQASTAWPVVRSAST